MLKRLLNWLFPSSFEIYSHSEILLYSYFDGEKLVKVDPIEIHKKVMDNAAQIDADAFGARSTSKFATPCFYSLVKTLREIFSIKSYDKGGLESHKVLEVFNHFLAFRNKVKAAFEGFSDSCGGNLALYVNTYKHGKKPTYLEFFGFYLNKDRVFYRQAGAVAMGAGVALGSIKPGLEYFKAITDGEEEAKLMKAQTETAQRVRNG